MTTAHHDPIATGAAANASTFNNPFGQLDAAIEEVDARIDALILSDGTSDAEVVDSRNGYTLLDDRLNDIVPHSNVIYVDAAFTVNAAAKRYATIAAALAVCTGGETIYIAPGIYTENTTIADDNVKLIGSGAPSYDSGTGRLVNGTIVRGYIRMGSTVGTVIRNLGVDLVGVDGQDCIGSNNVSGVSLNRTLENLTLLGNGFDALAHGIYGAGDHLQIRNIRLYFCYHGIAIHGSYVNISDIYLRSCGGSAIIPSAKTAGGNVHHVNINNVVMEGEAGGSYKLRMGAIQLGVSDAARSVRYVNISNVTALNCVNGVLSVDRSGGGEISDVNITNMVSSGNNDLAVVGDFRFDTGRRIVLNNCQSLNRVGGHAFKNNDDGTVESIYLINCFADSTGSGAYSGEFVIYDVNGEMYRPAGVPQVIEGSFRDHRTSGYHAAAISVTGANTPVCSLTDARGSVTSDYNGLLFVSARQGTSTANNSASYVLHVHRHYNNVTQEVNLISSAGLDSGAGGSYPSFTFSVDGTNHHLEATPIGSTSGTFYFTITSLGNIKMAAA